MMRRTLGLVAIVILLDSTASNADVSVKWETECVGRYQLSVPGDVDVAVDKLTELGTSTDSQYADGQIAPFAKLDYYGYLSVISPASETGFIKFKNFILSNRDKAKQEYLNSNSEREKKWVQGMKPIAYNTSNMFGWDSEDSHPRISYFRDNKIFSYSPAHIREGDNSLNVKHFNSFLNDFRTRALFELPKQPGVCFPYGFIPDSGTEPHAISVTMRLKDHPDIEVALRDTTYMENTYRDGESIQAYLDPKETINDFFAISELSNSEEKQELNFPGLHTVQMNGQKGGAVFVTITRSDGSKDYGYVATVQGTPDTPTLLLYVIRTASRAKGKPVSKDELKDMAEKIIASVKRHPVQ